MEENDSKPKKVYIVEYGEYSDRYIGAVFLDEKKAKDYAKYNRSFGESGYVSEYDVDDDSYEIVGSGYEIYQGSLKTEVSAVGRRLWNSIPKVSECSPKRYTASDSGTTLIYKTKEYADDSADFLFDILRPIDERKGPTHARELMSKILYDLAAEFESLVAESGSFDKALKAFRDKYEEDGDSDEDLE